jgi:hypothetical protein
MAGNDDVERRKQINSLRFSWHEKVLADAKLRKYPTALVLAGHVMHRFHWQKDYAEISFNSAVKALNMPRGSVIRARDLLIERGWLTIFEKPRGTAGSWSAFRYTLGGGPDDLALDAHTPSHTEETTEEAS